MLKTHASRIKFCRDQLQLLEEIRRSFDKPSTQQEFQQIILQCRSQILSRSFKASPRSYKAIKNKLKELYQFQEQKWTHALRKSMMDMLSAGRKYREIAEEPAFRHRRITNQEVKRKFETIIRSRYKFLAQLARPNEGSKLPLPSDNTFKNVIRQQELDRLLLRGIIKDHQYANLISIVPFLTNSQTETVPRKKREKEMLIKELPAGTDIGLVLKSMGAINNFITEQTQCSSSETADSTVPHPLKQTSAHTVMLELEQTELQPRRQSPACIEMPKIKQYQPFEEEEVSVEKLPFCLSMIGDQFQFATSDKYAWN